MEVGLIRRMVRFVRFKEGVRLIGDDLKVL
jgi:hypothetical protein